MNSINRGATGKKSRTNGTSFYMYSQTPHNGIGRKQTKKKGIRSYSNKRERIYHQANRSNDKQSNLNNLHSMKHKFKKPRIIDLSDSKSRKRLAN